MHGRIYRGVEVNGGLEEEPSSHIGSKIIPPCSRLARLKIARAAHFMERPQSRCTSKDYNEVKPSFYFLIYHDSSLRVSL